MPGPRYGVGFAAHIDAGNISILVHWPTKKIHKDCRDKELCHGPGCRVRTGKTNRKRQLRARRNRR